MWDNCGMARNEAGLKKALEKIPALREEFWKDVRVLGAGEELNQSLEKAGRVADFLELGELMCRDALDREESCGGHFREEYQTPDGEALRDDENFSYVAAWEYGARAAAPSLHKEPLDVRGRPALPEELQVTHEPHPARLAPEERARPRAASSTTRSRTSPTHVVPRDARRRQRGLIAKGEEPIAFDHDCREGICGMCGW